MEFSIRLKITCHGKRVADERGEWGVRVVVVHTKAFPVRKIYGTKSPLSKRQLWALLLYVGSCITVITTPERAVGSSQRERR
jgi:hypothetical protein